MLALSAGWWVAGWFAGGRFPVLPGARFALPAGGMFVVLAGWALVVVAWVWGFNPLWGAGVRRSARITRPAVPLPRFRRFPRFRGVWRFRRFRRV
jgi:hypothetical protein